MAEYERISKSSESKGGPHPDCLKNVAFWERIYKASPWLSRYEIEIGDTVFESIYNPQLKTHEWTSRVKEYLNILFIFRTPHLEKEKAGLKGPIRTTMNISFHQSQQTFQEELTRVVNGLNKI